MLSSRSSSRPHRPGASALAIAAVLVALAIAPSSARAQGPSVPPPGDTQPDPSPDYQANYQPTRSAGTKYYSPARAMWMPILGTVGSFALMSLGSRLDSPELSLAGAAGVLIAPSMGHFYTRDWSRALWPLGIRVGGLALATAGAISLIECFDLCSSNISGPMASVMTIGGIVGYIGGTAYSFWDAGDSARRANGRNRVMLVPTAMSSANGSRAMGFSLTGRF